MDIAAEAPLDPEDILSSSLQTLYSYTPITHSSAGSTFTYTTPTTSDNSQSTPISVTLRTPDTHSSNWSLHASSIWVSAIFLADHVRELDLDNLLRDRGPKRRLEVLELGAAAGLPGILVAKRLSERNSTTGHWGVTLSDYPDEDIVRTLEDNVKRNELESCCRVVPYAWGSDVSSLIPQLPSDSASADISAPGFDLIVAADTLWNSEMHAPFRQTLAQTLRRTPAARAHLIAGLHTGRYTLHAFMAALDADALEVERAEEREVAGGAVRAWCADREDAGDERERRRWVVWIVVKWSSKGV